MEENNGENTRVWVAQQYESAAGELERAILHLRWVSEHSRNNEVPRACAHVVATLGHLSKVDRQIKDLAELHATKAQV